MATRLEQLLELFNADPSDADLPYMIALEHATAGDPGSTEQALSWLDKTLSLNADYHYAYFQRAKLLDEDGRTDEAVAALDVGIERAQAAGNTKALNELTELRMSMAE